MSTNKIDEYKEKISQYIACRQRNTLIPFLRCPIGTLLGVLIFLFLLISFITFAIGVAIQFVLPKYDVLKLIGGSDKKEEPRNKSGNQPPDMSKLVKPILSDFLILVMAMGKRYFLLGLFSMIIFIILMVAICKRFQIIFFIILVACFVIGTLYLELGAEFRPTLDENIKTFISKIMFTGFKSSMCISCGNFNFSNLNATNGSIQQFEIVMVMLAKTLHCCGINGSEDYLKYNENKIPSICCKNAENRSSSRFPQLDYRYVGNQQRFVDSDHLQDLHLAQMIPGKTCTKDEALPGCFKALLAKADFVFDKIKYVTMLYVSMGLSIYLVIAILILETIYFYCFGFYRSEVE